MAEVGKHVVTEEEVEAWVAAFINSTQEDQMSMARAVLETVHSSMRMAAALRKIKRLMEQTSRHWPVIR
jgi:hypothetical protein